MDMIEKDGSQPVMSKPYKASPKEREIIKDIVKEWEELVARETSSPYASPVI